MKPAQASPIAIARWRAMRIHARMPKPKRNNTRTIMIAIATASAFIALWLCADRVIDKAVAYVEEKGALGQYALKQQDEIMTLREQLAAAQTKGRKRSANEEKMAAAVATLPKMMRAE